MQNCYFCHIWILACGFMACNTFHADKKSDFGVADFRRIVLYDYYVSFGSLELSGNKTVKQNKNEIRK